MQRTHWKKRLLEEEAELFLGRVRDLYRVWYNHIIKVKEMSLYFKIK